VDGLDEDAGFLLRGVTDIRMVLPSGALIKKETSGFTDVGSGTSRVQFIRTSEGLYSVQINPSQVRKVADCCGDDDVVPYISCCTPTSRVQVQVGCL